MNHSWMKWALVLFAISDVTIGQRTDFGVGSSSVLSQVLNNKLKGGGSGCTSGPPSGTTNIVSSFLIQKLSGCDRQSKSKKKKKINQSQPTNQPTSQDQAQSSQRTSRIFTSQDATDVGYIQVDANTYVSTAPATGNLDWSQYYARNNGLVSGNGLLPSSSSPGPNYAFADSPRTKAAPAALATRASSSPATQTQPVVPWLSPLVVVDYSDTVVQGSAIASSALTKNAVRGSFNPRDRT